MHGSAGIGAVSCNGVDYSVITDRLGYPKVVAECRKIIQAYHFKPFGEAVKVINESELVNILFGSYELDSETGLYYAKARLYDPGACRFLSPDPEWEFPSPYIFCGNDPFAVIDANGEASWYASLIGTVIGIVLTVGLSVLTMGASAPVATALFGAGGTTITAATSAAKTAAIVAYNVTATFAVSAVSGFSSTGIGHAIDGEPLTAPTAYDILFNSAVAGLVFGGAATLVSSVGKFVVGEADPLLMKARKYAAQGAILSLVNSGVSAAASPISDVMTGEPASGIGAAVSAGFGAISGMLTTFASAIAESNTLGITSDIKRELLNDTIWGGFDPGVYYGAVMDVVDSGSSEGTYDDFSVGTAHYIQSNKEAGPVGIKDEQITRAFACFSESNAFDGKPFTGSIRHASRNSTAPRYLATRGFGQKLA